jgi:hypothetical protein
VTGSAESGVTEPSWSEVVGVMNADNEVTWTCYYTGIVVDEIEGIVDMDVHVRPVGNGVVYLG